MSCPTDELISKVGDTLNDIRSSLISDMPLKVYELLNILKDDKIEAYRTSTLHDLFHFLCGLEDVENYRSSKDLAEVEGTIILHIMFAVKQTSSFGKIILALMKSQTKLLFNLFAASICLSISQIKRYNEQAIDLLKSTLINYAKEQEKARNCAWLRNAYGSNFEAMDFLTKLVENCCANGWDYAPEGLQELGFAFLETHLPKVTIVNGRIASECSNKVAHTACRWGEMIILQSFKMHRKIRGTLINKVLDAVFLQPSSALYYVELLSQFVLHGIASIVDSREKILQRFDDLLVLSSDVAAPFLKSIAPVLKLKPKMREKLVDVLRKAMFHKDIEARKTAVSGFLLFLKYFNVMDVLSSGSESQSQTFPTFSSQAMASTSVVDSEKSLERLCLEVVCCLRKAFTLQSEVRKLLYTGLCSSVRKNIQLLPAVIDLLDKQLVPYLENDEEKLPPIFIRKCIASSSKENVCLTEPLGYLIQSINICCNLYDKSSREIILSQLSQVSRFSTTVSNLKKIVMCITKRICKTELEDFELDKSADYSAGTKEGAENAILAFQLLSIYESVTEVCFSEEHMDVDLANTIIEIQERHSKLSEVLHEKCVISATKKTTNAMQSKADETNVKHNLKKCEHKVLVRLSSLVPFLEKLVLTNKISNGDEEAWQIIRTNVDFIRWIFNVLQGCVLELKSSFAGGLKLFKNLSALTKILYYLHIQHDQIDVELKRAKMMFLNEKSLEITSHVLELVCCHFKDNVEEYFNCFLVNDDSSENLRGKLLKIIQTFVRFLSRVLVGSAAEESSDNKASFKVALPLIRIIDFLLKLAPNIRKESTPISQSRYYDQVYNALWQICTNQHLTDMAVGKSLWTMLIRMQVEIKEVPKEIIVVAQNLLKVYGTYREEVEVPEPNHNYASINVKTVAPVSTIVLGALDMLSDCALCYVSKLKMLVVSAKDSPVALQAKERQHSESLICDVLMLQSKIWEPLLQAALPSTSSDAHGRSLQRFYGVLGRFVQYYLLLFQKKIGNVEFCEKFEKLIKHGTTQLTPNVYGFMRYFQDLSIKKVIKTSNVNFAKSKAIREMKCFSTLVLNIEQYEKFLLQLSAKSKINFMRFAKLGSNRDFRIDGELVKKTLNENVDEASDVDERNENETSMPISSTAVSTAARAKSQKRNSLQNSKAKAKRRKLIKESEEF